MPDLKAEEMSDEQRVAVEDMLAGPRNSLPGPFHAWLRSPEAGKRLARLGEYLRYQSPVPRDIQELVILMTAKHCNSAYEWVAHRGYALEAGLSEDALVAIQSGKRPGDLSRAQEAAHDFCAQLLRKNRVDDSAYDAAATQLGEPALIDLIALIGLYVMVAMTLSVAGVPVPRRRS